MELEELAETEWAVVIDDDVRFEPASESPGKLHSADADPIWVDGDPIWVDAYEI